VVCVTWQQVLAITMQMRVFKGIFFRCVTWVNQRLLPTTQELVGEFFLKSSEAWDVSPAIHRSISVVGDPRCESKNVLTELLPLWDSAGLIVTNLRDQQPRRRFAISEWRFSFIHSFIHSFVRSFVHSSHNYDP